MADEQPAVVSFAIGSRASVETLRRACVAVARQQVVFDEELLARLAAADAALQSNRSRRGSRGSIAPSGAVPHPSLPTSKAIPRATTFAVSTGTSIAGWASCFIRLSEVTTELTVHLLLDASGSMDWSGDPERVTKFTYARRVAGSLGYVGLWHFDRLTITPFSTQLGQPFGPSHGRSNITSDAEVPDRSRGDWLDLVRRIDRALCSRAQTARHSDRDLRPPFGRAGRDADRVPAPAQSGMANDGRADRRSSRSAIRRLRLRSRSRSAAAHHRADRSGKCRSLASHAQRKRRSTTTTVPCAPGRRISKPSAPSEQIPLITLQTDWPFETVVLGLLSQRGVVG